MTVGPPGDDSDDSQAALDRPTPRDGERFQRPGRPVSVSDGRLRPGTSYVRNVSDGYVVEIKPSARRTNGAVGNAVNRSGVRREFDGREAAEAWAADLASRGERRVWIRGANPNDERDVDAYLMGRRSERARRTTGSETSQRGLV